MKKSRDAAAAVAPQHAANIQTSETLEETNSVETPETNQVEETTAPAIDGAEEGSEPEGQAETPKEPNARDYWHQFELETMKGLAAKAKAFATSGHINGEEREAVKTMTDSLYTIRSLY